jgi:chemotaxis protein MotB
VQKGTAIGGATGGTAGAMIGHSMTSVGSGAGALVGVGVGAAGGAIAAERMGSSAEDEAAAAAAGDLQRLSQELAARDSELTAARSALDKEKAQQQALLEAYDKLRNQQANLQAGMPSEIQVTADATSVTYTLLSEVLFGSGQAELTSEGKGILEKAAASIHQSFPTCPVEVRGHTDSVPIRYSSFKSNWDLSCARAVAVVRYLIESEGFSADKLIAAGCGSTRPIASNKTEGGRRKNRRAEIVVHTAQVEVADMRASSN